MKKLALAVLLATTAFTPVLAADLGRPVYKAPVAVVAPYTTWNGFYIGANVGYGWGKTSAADAIGPLGAVDPSGFAGGGQIGYNWQVSPNWVLGVEADVQGADISDSNALYDTRTNLYGTVRGRLGYAVNNVLLYGTGGYAWGRNRLNAPGGIGHATHSGYAVGGGIEYAFSPGWSTKLEYLYVDLGREDYNLAIPTTAKVDFHTIKFGVNYRFGGGPIVAAY
jgi:outer membrane immunogenic protein